MRWPALLAALVWTAGCRPVSTPQTGPVIPRDCPEPPPAMSVTEAAGELARTARETRANLMARLAPSAEGQGEIFATLHPPGLSLLEAALASPGEAQRMDRAWMQSHLLSAHVELHARKPLAGLADGDVQGVVLEDGRGRRSRAIYMTVHRHSGGMAYRFFFDPLLFDREQERSMVTFKLPLGEQTLTARWRLSQETLAGMDDLPLLFWMSRERGVRLGRWALLLGDTDEARAVLSDELSCAPDLDAARELLRATRALPRQRAMPERLSLSPARLPARTRRELGHDPVQDLALRAAMLARLTPLAVEGVVAPAALRRAQQALRQAATALGKGEVGWSVASHLTDVDRALARLLADALDGKTGRGEAVTTLVLQGIPGVPEPAVTQELELRVLHANYDLVPRWVKGPPGFPVEGGGVSRVSLLELEPVVQGEHVVATLHRRLGWGWIHPGLPAERYEVRFVDSSEAYWRRRVEQIPQRATLGELRPLARQLLERELHSPSARVAGLAMAGLLELKVPGALERVLALVKQAPPERRGPALEAVARFRDPRIARAIAEATRSSDEAVRAGALRALGVRAMPAERSLLRAGLADASPLVSAAALEGLLQAGDASGVVQARRWLRERPERRGRLLRWIAQAPPEVKLDALGADLARLAGDSSPSKDLPGALVRVLGRRAVLHLNRLYGKAPELSAAVVRSAAGAAFEPLLRRALAEGPAEVRHLAALGLARQKNPPQGQLEQLVGDKDPRVQLAAHVGLARLGQAGSLLALGRGARGECWERRAVLALLCQSMEAASRARLLVDALESGCPGLLPLVWELARRYQPRDLVLLRAALGHHDRSQRVRAALAVLGLHAANVDGGVGRTKAGSTSLR